MIGPGVATIDLDDGKGSPISISLTDDDIRSSYPVHGIHHTQLKELSSNDEQSNAKGGTKAEHVSQSQYSAAKLQA
jgi:hypothetical protein